MKKEFFEPEVEVLLFDIDDIVTTSPTDPNAAGNIGEGDGGDDDW